MKIKFESLISLSFIIYLLGLILGYFLEYHPQEHSFEAYTLIGDISFSEIVKNNVCVISYEVFGSVFILPTINSLLFSGFALGLMLKSLILSGISLKKSLLLVIPHGIFEIPAIIIAGAAGFKIPFEITRYLAGRKDQILTRQDIKEYLTLALISIALIIIAAWIEANVTLRIAEHFIKTKGI